MYSRAHKYAALSPHNLKIDIIPLPPAAAAAPPAIRVLLAAGTIRVRRDAVGIRGGVGGVSRVGGVGADVFEGELAFEFGGEGCAGVG